MPQSDRETEAALADEAAHEHVKTRWSELRFGERIQAALGTRVAMVGAIVLVLLLIWIAAVVQDVSYQRLVSLTAWGVMLGGVIALGAIGLTLIYGVVRFPNFSHGALVSLGAYIALTVVWVWPGQSPTLGPFSFGWDLVLGLLIAMPLVGLVALALDRAVYRRLRMKKSSLVLFAMASLAMAFFVRSMIYLIWGSDFHFYYQGRSHPALELWFGMRIQPDQMFILGFALVLVGGLYLLLGRTKLGKAMRATANNPAGGVMYGLASQLRPEMGFYLLLPMFAAVIMGTIGNPRGALVGSLVIGVTMQVSTAFMNPAYGPAVAFLLMIITILLRPQGLFGGSGG